MEFGSKYQDIGKEVVRAYEVRNTDFFLVRNILFVLRAVHMSIVSTSSAPHSGFDYPAGYRICRIPDNNPG